MLEGNSKKARGQETEKEDWRDLRSIPPTTT